MGLSDTIFELVEEFQEMETQIGRKRPEIRAIGIFGIGLSFGFNTAY
jgi:hypothetical protein